MKEKYSYRNNLVSLVTPGWNGRGFVYRLFDSIIAQTYRPIEYIYVDDGSTDGTADVVKSYATKFKEAGIEFRYIWQENGGISEALMTGFQYVSGKYMSCPEYDDVLLPSSVEKRVNFLERHKDCAVVTADAWCVSEDNLEKRNEKISHNNPNRFDRNHFYQALNSNSIFNAACNMIRMDLFDLTHPNRKIIPSRIAPNQQILLPLYYHYNRGFIEEPLSLYVKRVGSVSNPIKSYETERNRELEYKRVLMETLSSIEIPDDLLSIYKKRVEINVTKDFVHFGYMYDKYDVMDSALKKLEELGEPCEEFIHYREMYRRKNNKIFIVLRKLFGIFS